MLKTYKYRLYPNKSQADHLNQHLGSTRFIYNHMLDLKIKAYDKDKTSLSRFDLQAKLPDMKNDKPRPKEINNQSLQATIENMDKAYKNFFKFKRGFPKFKSKHRKQSFSIPQSTKVNFELSKIYLPKIKTGINVAIDREFNGDIKTCTISKTCTGKYFISVLVDNHKDHPKKRLISENQTIGIDLGIKDLAVLSTGLKIQNPKNLNKSTKKITRLSRRLSRKVKGSLNRKKSKFKLALAHEHVTNQRNDFLHKISSVLIDQFDAIALEDLNIKGMVKNHKLAKSISDTSWSSLVTMLEYKALWQGKNIIKCGRFDPSSKMCSCGVKNDKLELKDRKWTCSSCGEIHDRDILAANNIKRFALNKIKIGQELPKFTLVEISSVNGRLALAKPKKHLVSETRNLNSLNNQRDHIDIPLLVVG